ncbi:helix-turn-helix domain-containing protein [Cohnella yongneupensis]|uniref:Helix-turn-helix domain-containing protein n=1 Tax=Cohnella yongneupensis TaxID=425006 RepID=A0ABW0R4Z3_9BACL
MSKNTLTVIEVADLLGVSTTTIYALVRERTIPFFRIRNRIFFRLESINDWIAQLEGTAVNNQ